MTEPRAIAFLGPEGSYSHQAAVAVAPGARMLGRPDFAAVCRAVEQGEAAMGVLPIENAVTGLVEPAALALLRSTVAVMGEHILPIDHCLVGATSTQRLEDIITVASHPQALMQCRRFIETRCPNAVQTPVSSTAEALEAVLADPAPGRAAIASLAEAERRGAPILARHIADNPDNYTRFLVIEAHAPTEIAWPALCTFARRIDALGDGDAPATPEPRERLLGVVGDGSGGGFGLFEAWLEEGVPAHCDPPGRSDERFLGAMRPSPMRRRVTAFRLAGLDDDDLR